MENIKINIPTKNIGNWTDNPCYYVTVKDGNQYGFLLGPFAHHSQALNQVDIAKQYVKKHYAKGVFYSFGTAKRENGHREGVLNNILNLDSMNHKPER